MYPEDIDVTVKISTPIYPTEDTDKIKSCLWNIFPDAELNIGEEEITGTSNSLETFAEIIENMKIRDTVRGYLQGRIVNRKCSFKLSKQATCNNKVNLTDDIQPLGEVHVTIESEEINRLIHEITKTGSE